MNFQTEDEILVRFINYLEDNKQFQIDWLTPDNRLFFFMLMWLGAILFPLLIIIEIYRRIPINWIIKKLGIEPRMKLVIFVNGKPLKKFKQLLEK